jgi:hypothetical protein
VKGIVRMMRSGFKKKFKRARTTATISAVQNESICTPGRT